MSLQRTTAHQSATMSSAQEQYLLDIAANAAQDHPIQETLRSPRKGGQRLSYVRRHATGTTSPEVVSTATLLKQAKHDAESNQYAACVIENISPEYMAAVGVGWNIARDFFIQHAANPVGDRLWEAVMGGVAQNRALELSYARIDLTQQQDGTRALCDYYSIEGYLNHVVKPGYSRFGRRLEHDPHWGWQTNTKISYCRVSKYFCEYDHSYYERSLTAQISFWWTCPFRPRRHCWTWRSNHDCACIRLILSTTVACQFHSFSSKRSSACSTA